MESREPLRFRRARPDELHLVKSSWFESYRKGGCAPEVAFPTYRTGQNRVMENLLARAPVWVATLEDVPDEVLGWVCYDDKAVHYLYVKQAYRKRRIATALLSLARAAGAKEFTHPTRAGKPLAKGLNFNPYITP
jgi:GNAT superfamily N-acetyltransferase